MADYLATGSTGSNVAFDDISSVFYARQKIIHGADGVNDGDVSTANPLPVRLYVGTTSAAMGGGTEAAALRVTIASDSTGVVSVDDNGSTISIDDGGSSITVDGTVAISGTVTVASHAVTNAGTFAVQAVCTNAGTFAVQVDGNALTSLQLIDDVVYIDNASFTDDTSKFALIGGVYQSSPQTITDGKVAPISLDANGRVLVAAHAVTQSGTWNVGTVTTVSTVSSVTNVATIGTSVTPGTAAAHLGKAEDAAHNSGDTGVMMLGVRADTPASTGQSDGDYTAPTFDSSGRLWCNVNNTVTVASHAVTNAGTFAVQAVCTNAGTFAVQATCTNAGTFAVQVDGNALTSLQLIDDIVFVDDAAFTPGTSKVAAIGLQADESSTDSVDEGDVGCPRMTLDRKQIVTPQPHTAGGCLPIKILDSDESEDQIKGSPGQLYELYCFNSTDSILYVKLYNDTAANVTVGSTTPVLVIPVPGNADSDGAGVVRNWPTGLAFDTAITIATTTGIADNDTGAPGANAMTISGAYK